MLLHTVLNHSTFLPLLNATHVLSFFFEPYPGYQVLYVTLVLSTVQRNVSWWRSLKPIHIPVSSVDKKEEHDGIKSGQIQNFDDFSCLWEGSCLICVFCVCFRTVVSDTYCVVFLFFLRLVFPRFSGLSFFDCPFGIL